MMKMDRMQHEIIRILVFGKDYPEKIQLESEDEINNSYMNAMAHGKTGILEKLFHKILERGG
ncbi:hypothetical protein [Lactovum miscens]|uniref:hypothetical protein n=1 Tax=Lactovum miscens TaxID=190387 RepID=UPI002ED9F69C